MKHYITLLATIFIMSGALYTNAFGDQKPFYAITVLTSGDDALVDAIKQYSDLTKADENSWKYSWVPGLAAFTRWRVMSKIEEYLKVCRGIMAKTIKFHMYTPAQKCNAFDNLEQQGVIAQALLGQIGANRVTNSDLYQELGKFINIHREAKRRLDCSAVKQEQESNEEKELKRIKAQAKIDKIKWKARALKWEWAKSVGSTAFQGAKWIAQTINENSAPLISAAAAWYVYDKLFGTRRPATTPTWYETFLGTSAAPGK
jgi:hypothetical protein